jgi:hypothetical protein
MGAGFPALKFRARCVVEVFMGSPENRRDRRYDARIPVAFLSLKSHPELFTENVSYRGLFVRTQIALPERQLLRVRLTPTGDSEPIETNVVVAVSRPTGAGVSFFGLDGAQRIRWERFIESFREAKSGTVRSAPTAPERARDELVLAAATIPALERLSRDMIRGTILVHGPETLAVDAPVSLRLVHPLTQSEIVVAGIIQQRHTGGGVAVGTRIDARMRARLADFVESAGDYAGIDVVGFDSMPAPAQMRTQA